MSAYRPKAAVVPVRPWSPGVAEAVEKFLATKFRVWGLGALLFLVLTILTVLAGRGRGND